MAIVTPAILASLPEFPSPGDSVQFQFNGLVVVFTALALIWGLVELMGWIFRLRARRTVSQPAPTLLAAESSRAETGMPPEVVVAIAAAVHTCLAGTPHRIRAITAVGAGLDWAREGRRNIFASHQPH